MTQTISTKGAGRLLKLLDEILHERGINVNDDD
jgi:hypothetical protein